MTRALLIGIKRNLWFLFFVKINLGFCQPKVSGFTFVDPEISIQKWVGKKMPTFAIKDISGKTYNNKSLEKKVIVINLWSITCETCIEEIPDLNNLTKRYAHRDIIFLAPTPDTKAKVIKMLARNPFKYTVLPQAQGLFESLDLPGYPYHILVDGSGLIRFIQTGTVDFKTGKKITDEALPNAIKKVLE